MQKGRKKNNHLWCDPLPYKTKQEDHTSTQFSLCTYADDSDSMCREKKYGKDAKTMDGQFSLVFLLSEYFMKCTCNLNGIYCNDSGHDVVGMLMYSMVNLSKHKKAEFSKHTLWERE